jgi:hypothetical protein
MEVPINIFCRNDLLRIVWLIFCSNFAAETNLLVLGSVLFAVLAMFPSNGFVLMELLGLGCCCRHLLCYRLAVLFLFFTRILRLRQIYSEKITLRTTDNFGKSVFKNKYILCRICFAFYDKLLFL